jgi:hypothetical protein
MPSSNGSLDIVMKLKDTYKFHAAAMLQVLQEKYFNNVAHFCSLAPLPPKIHAAAMLKLMTVGNTM